MADSMKQVFLENYDREHERTMRVLRAYPTDKLDFKPHEMSKSARDLAWVFVMERGLGTKVWHDELIKSGMGAIPPAPQNWNDLLAALEKANKDFRALIASASEAELAQKVHFLTGPKQMGELSRIDFVRFLLFDQIHHRGQFSIYLRMTGAKVPSIYGPSADEPWM